jgi:hypothetical protein
MSRPTPGDVHVNTPLTNISIAYMQQATNFISNQVFPNIPVTKQSDRYYVYDRGEFNRDEMTERAPGTESAGGSYKLDNTPTYFSRVYAFHKDIPDEVRANSDSVVQPDRDATNFVTMKALIKREALWASKYFTTSVWGTDATPSVLWSAANSTPIADVKDAKRTMLADTGFEPNTLVLGKKVYDVLTEHPAIIDRVKYGQTTGNPAMAGLMALMALLEIERVFIMKAIKNSEPEKATAFSHPPSSGYWDHDFIGDANSALLCYAAPSPALMAPTAGYTFSWTGLIGAGNQGNRIKRFRMDQLNSDRVEIDCAFDQKLVAADLGYFFDTCVESD